MITNIGHDHMQLLGDTLEKIAWEKAGIIKEGVPLLTAEKRPSCLRVFETVCAQRHASLYRSSAHDVRRDETGTFILTLPVFVTCVFHHRRHIRPKRGAGP